MYTIDEHDQVRELTDFPQQSVGAPLPIVLATEQSFVLGYYTDDDDDRFIIVEFDRVLAHFFGGPNDEALDGHPLSDRGLEAYAVFEVFNSSWLRGMERMNRVHPSHYPEAFEGYRHFIFTFHDTPLEVLAEGVRNVTSIALDGHERLGELVKRSDPGRRSRV